MNGDPIETDVVFIAKSILRVWL